ncbi:hypothetical protein BBJ28_00024479, partial [Nothophytophthora sp. Chile5]
MWPRTRELPTRFAPTTHWKLFPRDDKLLPGAAAAASKLQAIAPHHRHSTARVRRTPNGSPPTGRLGPVHTHFFGRPNPPVSEVSLFKAVRNNPWVQPVGSAWTHLAPSHLPEPPPKPFRRIQSGSYPTGNDARKASLEPECELPMDMECGCKTRREKEQREQAALAEAAARRQPALATDNQQAEPVKAMADMVTRSPAKPVQSSFHRRHLPLDCIAFSSAEGRKLFTEAINSPRNFMQIYFPLAEQFITQAEPAFCGLATLAMCLNALQIDPGRLWKGPWRWFSEELFDCCTSLSVAKEKGISMSEFICLARCN